VKVRGFAPLAVACVVHAGVVAGVALGKRPLPPLVWGASRVNEVELEPAPIEDLPPAGALGTSTEWKSEPPRAASGHGGRALAKLAPRGAARTTGPDDPHDDSASDPTSDGRSFSPFATHIDTAHAFTPDLTKHDDYRADATPPAPVSKTGGLAEGLAARDLEAGLGRGGSILTAAEAAARGSDAPLRGDATFDVVVRSDGKVEAHVASASSDLEGWREVAAVLQRSVDGRSVRIAPGARGWRVVVRVEAKVVFADGRDTQSVHGVRGEVAPSVLSNAIEGKPGARGSSTGPGGPDHVDGEGGNAPPMGGALGPEKPTHVASSAIVGLAMRVLPTPTISVEGKVCRAGLSITPLGVGFGGGCSFENIGNGTRRVVTGRIVRDEAM
jgi:hypothetical protein